MDSNKLNFDSEKLWDTTFGKGRILYINCFIQSFKAIKDQISLMKSDSQEVIDYFVKGLDELEISSDIKSAPRFYISNRFFYFEFNRYHGLIFGMRSLEVSSISSTEYLRVYAELTKLWSEFIRSVKDFVFEHNPQDKKD